MELNRERIWRWVDTAWRYSFGLVCKYPREAVILALSVAIIVLV